jgi:hypothetical protein
LAAVIGVLGSSFQAQAEPCGTPPLVPGDPGVVAPNCMDCTNGCTIYKYGLGHPDNFDFRRRSNDPFVFALNHSDFPTGSYAYNRGTFPTVTGARDCGPERDFAPIQGQAVLREQDGCTPTSIGATCTAGTNLGRFCHLPVGSATAPNTVECGTGGTCTLGAGSGCPVEIPRAVSGVTPVQDKTTWSNGARVVGTATTLLTSSSAVLGGTSNPNDATCLAANIRLINALGTRYLLPSTHPLYDGTGNQTYIKWLDESGRGLVRHDDDSEFCCQSPTGLACATAGGTTPFQEYPVNTKRTCAQPNRIYQLLQTNAWIFEGGPGTPFISDPEHIVPGNLFGVCTNNRFRACTAPGAAALCGGASPPACCATATCGAECNSLGDTCDLRERGIRQTIPANQATGFPQITACNTFIAVLRGTPGQYCLINNKYEVNGDPGAGCLVWNFGFRPRPDLDCNGTPDAIANGGAANDLCPFNNEYDYSKDSDGDCALAEGCRGDECECTDLNLDGLNTVSDIVSINTAIFNTALQTPICDGNNDLVCTVSDIVAANIENFRPDSSTCRHLTSIQCGNAVVNTGEECDDGARCTLGGVATATPCDATVTSTCPAGQVCERIGGDGCSSICRLE